MHNAAARIAARWRALPKRWRDRAANLALFLAVFLAAAAIGALA